MYSMLTLSIVSHGQGHLIRALLEDLENLLEKNFQVIVTINIPENELFLDGFSYPLRIIRNQLPKGFGANHNAAFSYSETEWFAIVNPDIRVPAIDFAALLLPFNNKRVAAVAPTVFSGEGKLEDSARYFPTIFRIAKRVLFKVRSTDYLIAENPFPVDWVAGMFVVYRRDAFKQVKGFDDKRFFMYLEDADICRRLAKAGWLVFLNPDSQVFHFAQRKSRTNFMHMRWHIISLLRYISGL